MGMLWTRQPRKSRSAEVAQAPGRTLFLDCQRHLDWWFGVVKLRDTSDERVVHVCVQLRASAQAALDDADSDAQKLALMFAQ